MCTVSWIHEPGGYQLLCNRDEKRTRKTAASPSVRSVDGVRFIAPADGDFGGTWIAANQFGITLCLLNGHATIPTRATKSRGLLLLELGSAVSAAKVLDRTRDLSSFAPFTLAILEPARPAVVVEWDGSERTLIHEADHCVPLVSSSFDPAGVRLRRKQQYQRMRGAPYFFHESHGAHADAYSPCMHREDAQTVSFSWVRVNESAVDFFYTPGAPCEWKPGERIILERTCLS